MRALFSGRESAVSHRPHLARPWLRLDLRRACGMSLGIQAIDNFLPPAEHQAVWAFLAEGGWRFGAGRHAKQQQGQQQSDVVVRVR